ncbi:MULTISPECIES: RNA polymerase sigma factor [Sphingobium]|uniref:RNA polymerase sigma24 factor n=1 Tax=Sphingobium chungbukense TaxID=56193 RepID=A0A0M3AZ45_9SPHN|nr:MULTISPECIES: RNA polymerase sigma factor [Sphingobium]KKW94191.1 RNA polymerase sigma24 factor [Sphingobium chungbukense]PJG49773.1 RNA polymerase subunit sigma-24 [Sphingobium sp. LB126]
MRRTQRRLSVDVIEAAQQGDREALLSLLVITQPDIRRYAQRSCQAADIDDAVQESLWILNRRIGGLRAISAFTSWLFQIVVRECQRLTRKRMTAVSIEHVADNLDFSSRSEPELRLDLAAGLESLPPHYREIVLLRDMQSFTIDEIAATLGLTREAVKARLHRARHLLREYLK